jgi:hypothetical protein
MENPTHGKLFEATFTAEVNAAFVEALRAAYETACEHYVPEQGSNETTFGFNLYHHAVHEHCKMAEVVEGLEVLSRNPTFRLGVGEFELACHRVGSSERENIWASFPNNEGAACTMVEEQLWLPSFAQYLGIEKARKLILAHFGSPEDGLRAVYLCIPGKTENGRITAWMFAQPLWVAEQEERVEEPRPDLPPEEVVDAPVVTRKPKLADIPSSELPKVEPEEDKEAEVARKATGSTEKKGGDGEIR